MPGSLIKKITFVVLLKESDVMIQETTFCRFPFMEKKYLRLLFEENKVIIGGEAINSYHCATYKQKIIVIYRLFSERVEGVRSGSTLLNILYEDLHLIAVNKPSGMPVHPGNGTPRNTLVYAVFYFTDFSLSLLPGNARPGVVHRLDKDTTGVLIFAKMDKSYLLLKRIFLNHQIDKQYLAVVNGNPALFSGSINKPIGRCHKERTKMTIKENGKTAYTEWRMDETISQYHSIFRFKIYTGRTHQIRVHLSYIGHPILGDYKYSSLSHLKKNSSLKTFLHSIRISFRHPTYDKIFNIESPLPIEFKLYQESLS